MKNLTFILLLFLLGCDYEIEGPDKRYNDLNKFPSIFQNLETDIAYFRDNVLVMYNIKNNTEQELFTSKIKPNNHFWSANGRYAFYWESFWVFGGQTYRYDRINNIEVPIELGLFSSPNISYDGEKYLEGGLGTVHYNLKTKKKVSVDSVIFQFLQDTSYRGYTTHELWKSNNVFSVTARIWRKSDTTTKYFSITLSDSNNYLTVIDTVSIALDTPSDDSSSYNNDRLYYFYFKDVGCIELIGCSGRRCYIVNTKTQATVQLLPEANSIRQAVFSPSGKYIVFSAYLYDAQGDYRDYVFVANVDGSSPALISNRGVSSGYPAIVNPLRN